MTTFVLKKIDAVKGSRLFFYKVERNGVCLFDKFCADAQRTCKSEFLTLLAYMNFMAESNSLLPDTKFKAIKGKNIANGYEFKTKHLRVYVIKKDPNVWIILGGYKNTQKKDINSFERMVEEINTDGFKITLT